MNFFKKIWYSPLKIKIGSIFSILMVYLIYNIFPQVFPIIIQKIQVTKTKGLSYEMVSLSRHIKFELNDVANKEGLEVFNLNLDDPIIPIYHLFKVRLRNHGPAVNMPLNIEVAFQNYYTKILDIKHKVISPKHKILKLSHCLPSLVWNTNDSGEEIKFAWSYDQDQLWSVAGFNVYWSCSKDRGYGKFNEKLITNTEFSMPYDISKNSDIIYLSVSAVGLNGAESDLVTPLKLPDILAYSPSFKNACFIDPDTKEKISADGSLSKPFHSLSEAVKKADKKSVFMVNNDINNDENVPHTAKVFYKKDIGFLHGKTNILLPNGIDEEAEIILFFLCKIIPNDGPDLNLRLVGVPDISFQKSIKKVDYPTNEKSSYEEQKYLLTPKIVKTYVGNDTIYLAWEKPSCRTYKGVRVFRYIKADLKDPLKNSVEIYDGPGITKTLIFEVSMPIQSRKSCKKSNIDFRKSVLHRMKDLTPPPRKGVIAPSPAYNLKILPYTDKKEIKMHFIADYNASKDVTYTYILYAYDDKGKYSYPIFINATLNDSIPEIKYYFDTGKSKGDSEKGMNSGEETEGG